MTARTKRRGPRILLLDIETSPILAHVWKLFDNNVALNQIVRDTCVISWAAKWLGERKVFQQDQRDAKSLENDKALLKPLWRLLDEADIIVTQNGKQFDIKRLNARFVLHGYKPPSPVKHVDTLEIAKRKFGFTSNKLEYMTNLLNRKYKKLKHEKFSGFELWSECLKGNRAAWREMAKYNRYDVLALEELYLKLRPWDDKHPNPNAYHDGEAHVCRCGSENVERRGYHRTTKGKYQRYQCLDCGAWSHGGPNLFDKEKRASLRSATPAA